MTMPVAYAASSTKGVKGYRLTPNAARKCRRAMNVSLVRCMAADLDGYRNWGVPVMMCHTSGHIKRKPPSFGEHGREILAEAGCEADEIEALVEEQR